MLGHLDDENLGLVGRKRQGRAGFALDDGRVADVGEPRAVDRLAGAGRAVGVLPAPDRIDRDEADVGTDGEGHGAATAASARRSIGFHMKELLGFVCIRSPTL